MLSIQGNGASTLTATGNASVTIAGGGNNTITSDKQTNVTITGGGDNTIYTGSVFSTITDEGTGGNIVHGGTGGGVYIGGLNAVGSPFSSKGGSSVLAPSDNFSVQLAGYSSYLVTNSGIQYGSFSLTCSGVDSVTLTTPTSTVSAGNTITLSGWTGSTQINASGNNNTLDVNPGATTSAVSYVLTESQLTATIGQSTIPAVSFSDIQTANLTGGNGTNSFTVSAWTGNGSLTGPNGSSNTLYATDNTNFALTNTQFSRSNAGNLALSGIQNAVLTGGSGADTFTVSNWSGNATLNGVSGKNIFNLILSGATNGVYNVSDSASISSDVLNVTAGQTVTLTADLIDVGSQSVNYHEIAILGIDGGASALTFDLQATDAATSTVLQTFGINNVINVGSTVPATTGVASGIAGALSIKGNGQDTLNVYDTGDQASQTDVLTASTLTGLGMGGSGITYSKLSNLNIYLGDGVSTFTIVTTAVGTANHLTTNAADTVDIRALNGPTTVTTTSGANTINVGSTAGETPLTAGNLAEIEATLTVAGTGQDVLNLDDTEDTIGRSGTITNAQVSGFGLALWP